MNKFLRQFLVLWLPVVVWGLVIYFFSDQIGSEAIGHEMRGAWSYALRKLVHGLEYAVLVILFFRAFSRYRKHPWFCRTRGVVFWAVLLSLAYAVFDEFHQTLIVGREGQLADVLFDSGGILIGLAIWLGLKKPCLARKVIRSAGKQPK